MSKPKAAALAKQIESLSALDGPGKFIGKRVRNTIKAGAVKDALSGTWLGHALHPLLTDVVIGSFTSAVVLDAIGGDDAKPAARTLIKTGLAATPAVLATGWSDWADTEVADDGVRRVGLVHASSNGAAVSLMVASLIARSNDSPIGGKLLALAGAGAMGLGGWLGGHLTLGQGVGVDNTTFDTLPEDWTSTGIRDEDLAEGQPRCGEAGGTPVLLVREQGTIKAIANTCSHRGGPLDEGDYANGTITCPWHASVFNLDDGGVERGPAAYPQPSFETRVNTGMIEVRAKN
jgi:nitrite reductase/ring-hydroxylating ferredoxin subunit/uncharacterized membrane protein